MSGGSKTLLIILLIPFFAALGHDIYYNYFSEAQKVVKTNSFTIEPKKFRATDAGWVFIQYAPGAFQATRKMTPEPVWKNAVDPILRLPTMIACLIPFSIGIVITMLNNLLGHNQSIPNSKAYMQGKAPKQTFKRR